MLSDSRAPSQVALQKARILEEQGQLQDAVDAYLKVGAALDAARVLVRLNRYADAGKLVLKTAQRIQTLAGKKDEAKKLALTAAKLLERGGETPVAAGIYRSFGLGAPKSSPVVLTQLAPSAADAQPFTPEKTVANRYRLESKLGEGGLGTVFRATDLELMEPVALKVLDQTAGDEQALANFRKETKLTRQLTHPNVIRLFDIGIHAGYRFITMELLLGRDLRGLIGEPLDVAQGLGYLSQACAGLQAAHDLGIVHRDVKPENLFIVEGGPLKVMDFGIARQSQGVSVSFGGQVAGTPAYISPEQINEFESVGPSADLYSLGVVAYEMFTGAPPFTDADPTALLTAHLEQTPVPPTARNPQIPRELDEVILRLLEKSPARRYRSCRELTAAIEPIRQRHAVEDFF